jgi:prophage antirepressor-like protein
LKDTPKAALPINKLFKFNVMSFTENENGLMSAVEFTNSENKTIRTVMEDGEPMFVAKDVFDVLGIKWRGADSLPQISKSWQGVRKLPTPKGGIQSIIVVNEAAVFKVAFRSNKPEADRFTDWVAGEVLPQIRKQGFYSLAKPINGVDPVLYPGKAWYNYLDMLEAMGYSRRSGSVTVRKRVFPQHFAKLFGRNFITAEFCNFLQQRKDAVQLTFDFVQANKAIAGGQA